MHIIKCSISFSGEVFLGLLLILTFHVTVFAQEKKDDVAAPETQKEIKLEKKQANKLYSLSQFGHESVLFVKQPTKWKGDDWLKFGVVIGSTIAVMPFDERITNSTQGNQHYYNSTLVEGGRMYGGQGKTD